MKNVLFISLLAMAVSCWSCSGGGEDEPTPTPTPQPEEKPKIEVTTTAPVLAQNGGSATVTFTSTDSWTIEVTEGRSASWCSVTPISGNRGANTLTINAAMNDTFDDRNAKVTIRTETLSISFVVTQKQKDAIVVAQNEYNIEAIGGDLRFEVNSNVDFKVATTVDWIKQNTGSRGLVGKALSLVIEKNEKAESREGEIVITYQDLKQTIKVIQKGASNTGTGTGAELEPGGGIEEG